MPKLAPTASQTLGPFYAYGLIGQDDNVLAGPNAKGQRARLEGVLSDDDGNPVRDALIEIWQADSAGKRPGRDADADPDFKGFGRVLTDADGLYCFHSVLPGASDGSGNAVQAPHVMFGVFCAGLTKRVVTRAYLPDAPELESDPVLHDLAAAARASLIAATSDRDGATLVRFDLKLGGKAPTTFFAD